MKIYAIPGLGTTKTLYANTQLKNHELIVLNWPTPEKNDTLISYAKKFIPQINTHEPFCLMGVSFGGMLCVEISKMVSPTKIILISTCKSREELPWFIRVLKYVPLHLIISERYHRQLAYVARGFIGFGSDYTDVFMEMINKMEVGYFKYCIKMIATWDNKTIPKNYYHIHGTKDKLLLNNSVKADVLIDGGTHAMIIFRAKEINALIEKELENINI